MSQFEYLRSIPVGQYLPVDSAIHRLDPRVRLLAVVIVLMALTFARGLIGLLVGMIAGLVCLIFGKIPMRYALRALVTPLPILAILAVLQVAWNAGPDAAPVFWTLGSFQLTLNDFRFGGVLLLRFSGLILGLGLLSYTTSTTQLTQGLNGLLQPLRYLRIPVDDFVMMVQITLRFLPLLALSAERIAKAQAARGADWDSRTRGLFARVKQVVPMLVPLFLTSLHRAENMALAMDARGYGAAARTSFVNLKMQPRDWAALAVAVVVGTLILVL
jgi:energy-coupling factor transport system permease protein